MALIKNRPLGVLDRIYNFVGAQTPTEADVDVPVQFVHDLSREAEIGSAFGRFRGYAVFIATNTHAGAGVIRSAWDPYARIVAGSIDPNYSPTELDMDVWLLGFQTTVQTPANLTTLSIGWSPLGAIPPSTTDAVFPLLYSTEFNRPFSQGNALGDLYLAAQEGTDPSANVPGFLPRPLYMPHGSTFTLRSNAGGATNVQASFLVWVGRVGTAPYGSY